MLERAVVGIDHSPATDPLIGELRQLPRLGVRQVTLVTVLGGNYPQMPEERHRDHYRHRLEEMARTLGEFESTVEVRSGHPAAELRSVAAATDADVLVVGSHGHTPWRDLFLGSVVLDLLRTSRWPVLLLPLHTSSPDRGGGVLLATDGSQSAAGAEQLAYELGQTLGGVATTILADAAGVDDVTQAEEHLAQVADRVLTPRVEQGPLPETIGRLAQRQAADMIVVGARGRNPLTGLLLGSTAEHLLRTTNRPVLLVPHGR